MDSTHLRKGNLVQGKNIERVTAILAHGLIEIEDSESTFHFGEEPNACMKPIPLTPELLEKFGFTQDQRYFKLNQIKIANVLFREGPDGYCVYHEVDGASSILAGIYYVHQLQNLYFAITGEELTIKSLINV